MVTSNAQGKINILIGIKDKKSLKYFKTPGGLIRGFVKALSCLCGSKSSYADDGEADFRFFPVNQ